VLNIAQAAIFDRNCVDRQGSAQIGQRQSGKIRSRLRLRYFYIFFLAAACGNFDRIHGYNIDNIAKFLTWRDCLGVSLRFSRRDSH
jgi:hypothetical protein